MQLLATRKPYFMYGLATESDKSLSAPITVHFSDVYLRYEAFMWYRRLEKNNGKWNSIS